MKLRHSNRRHAFTLVEVFVSLAVFSLIIAAMLSSQLFGMKVNATAAAKLVATADARHAMDRIRDQIRNGNTVYVGSWNGSAFTITTNGATQQGNALQIYPTTNIITYYLYYVTSTNNQLSVYYGDGTNGITRTLANNVTNSVVFDVEDYQGNVLTDNQNNRIVRMTLDFLQFEYASGQRGNAYNHYRVQMRATQRLLN